MDWNLCIAVLAALVLVLVLCKLWRSSALVELTRATSDDPARASAADRLGAAPDDVEWRGDGWRLKAGAKAVRLEPAADPDAPLIANELTCARLHGRRGFGLDAKEES